MQTPITAALLDTTETLHLGVAIGAGSDLLPRQVIAPTPYAVMSQSATNVTSGGTVETNSVTIGAEVMTDTKITLWDDVATEWGTTGLAHSSETTTYQANGASTATNLGADNGPECVF